MIIMLYDHPSNHPSILTKKTPNFDGITFGEGSSQLGTQTVLGMFMMFILYIIDIYIYNRYIYNIYII